MEIPTVKIVSDSTPEGFVIINEADFDHSKHVRFKESPKTKTEDPSFFEGDDPPTSSRQPRAK